MSQVPTHPAAEAATAADKPKGPPPGVTGRPAVQIPDLSEKGGMKAGQPQKSDRRLFMQLLAYTHVADHGALGAAMAAAGIEGVVYEDVTDPHGAALLTFHRDPNFFVDVLHPLLRRQPFAGLTPLPQLTMFGRTYSLGYEPNLEETLFDRPRRTVLNPAWRWAVWYPLRRSGQFERLSREEQMAILREHGEIGMAYGAGDFAHDIRLACHGMDRHDNDFVVGLVGRELYPLSHVVQSMRKTQQTSLYLTNLGPFWVGRAVWQSAV
jgi:chlorite dismutase